MPSPINPYEAPREISAPSRAAFLEHPIRAAGQLSWSDGLHALRLAMRPPKPVAGKQPLSRAALVGVFILALLVALGPVVQNPLRPESYVLVLIVLLIAAIPLQARLRLYRQWKRKEGVFAAVERIITQDGIERRVGRDVTFTPWTAYTHFRRSDRVVLLFERKSTRYLILARSCLTNELEWQALVDFLQAKFREA
jgi:hypothetical protein